METPSGRRARQQRVRGGVPLLPPPRARPRLPAAAGCAPSSGRHPAHPGVRRSRRCLNALAAGQGLRFQLADPASAGHRWWASSSTCSTGSPAVLDAYRLARDRTVGDAAARLLSTVGLRGHRPRPHGQPRRGGPARASGLRRDPERLHDPGPTAADDTPPPDASLAAGHHARTPRHRSEPSHQARPAPPRPATPTPEPTPTQGPDWDGKKRLNILLIGADGGRADYSSYLTDTMIVVSIDPRPGKVAFISLPRDMQGIPLPTRWPAYRAYGGRLPRQDQHALHRRARYYPSLFPGNDRSAASRR